MSRQLTLLQELPAVPHRAHAHDGQPQLAQEQALQGGDSAGTLRCDTAGTSLRWYRCHLPLVALLSPLSPPPRWELTWWILGSTATTWRARTSPALVKMWQHRGSPSWAPGGGTGTCDTRGHGTHRDTGHSGTRDTRGHRTLGDMGHEIHRDTWDRDTQGHGTVRDVAPTGTCDTALCPQHDLSWWHLGVPTPRRAQSARGQGAPRAESREWHREGQTGDRDKGAGTMGTGTNR